MTPNLDRHLLQAAVGCLSPYCFGLKGVFGAELGLTSLLVPWQARVAGRCGPPAG